MENPIQLQVIADSLHNRLSNRAVHLPRFPGIAGAALQLARTPGSQPHQLIALLEQEPALIEKLHDAVSSAFFGRHRWNDLPSAVEHLGLQTTADLAFGLSIHAGLFYAPGYYQCIVEQLRSSLLCAAWSREIALARRRHIEGAFLCGLLKSIGRPVVIEAALECAVRHRMHLSYADLLILADQFENGTTEWVLNEWNMPESVQQAAQHWPDYRFAGEAQESAMTVAAAARLAIYAGREGKQNGNVSRLLKERVFRDLGITEKMLNGLLARRVEVADLASIMIS